MHVVLFIFRVLPTIKLYDNFLLNGDEVYDVCFNRLLSAEFDTLKLTVSQMTPEYAFNISCVISQFYRILPLGNDVVSWRLPPPPSPLPQGAGGLFRTFENVQTPVSPYLRGD